MCQKSRFRRGTNWRACESTTDCRTTRSELPAPCCTIPGSCLSMRPPATIFSRFILRWRCPTTSFGPLNSEESHNNRVTKSESEREPIPDREQAYQLFGLRSLVCFRRIGSATPLTTPRHGRVPTRDTTTSSQTSARNFLPVNHYRSLSTRLRPIFCLGCRLPDRPLTCCLAMTCDGPLDPESCSRRLNRPPW